MTISRERISEEITKSIAEAKSVVEYFKLMTETEVIYNIAPEFLGMETRFHDNRGSHYGESVYQHTLDVAGRLSFYNSNETEKLIMTLAAYFHDVGKMLTVKTENNKTSFLTHDEVGAKLAGYRLRALRFPSEIVRPVTKLIALHMKLNEMSRISNPLPKKQFARMLVFDFNGDYLFKPGNMNQLMALCSADQNDQLCFPHHFGFAQPLITGKDIETVEPKNIRGDLLKQMYFLQLSQDLTKEELQKRLNGEAHNILEGRRD
jgi:putative nucleotidyltransferase with HDIG domain